MPLFGPPDIEKLKAKRDVQGLIKALSYEKDSIKDKPRKTREEAASTLGEIGGALAVEPLIAALNDGSNFVRWEAAGALGKLGDGRAVIPLSVLLNDDDKAVREHAVYALRKLFTHPGTIELLIAELANGSVYRRRCAAKALSQAGDARAVEPLIAALLDEEYTVRMIALEGLEKICNLYNPANLALLKQLQQEGLESICIPFSQQGQIKIENKSTVESLFAALRGDQEMRGRVSELMEKVIFLDCSPFIPALRDAYWIVRQTAAGVLERQGWKPVTDADKAWFWAAKGDWVRSAALSNLTEELLIKQFAYAYPDERQAVVEGLGKIGSSQAVESLFTLLINIPDMRRQVVNELDRLGWKSDSNTHQAWYWIAKGQVEGCIPLGKAAVDPLLTVLDERQTENPESICYALGQIGAAQAVEPLIRLLRHKRGSLRKAAASALVSLYQQGRLTKEEKSQILLEEREITQIHTDHIPSYHSESEGYYEGNCSVTGGSTWSQGSHTDEGIGVDFPL